MKPAIISTAVTLIGILSLPAHAQDATEGKWRVGLGYRPMLNLDVSFRNAGVAPAPNNPSVTGRSYADGFVGVDSTGNALDLTTYWGYERDAQYAGDAIVLRNSQSGGLGEDDNLWANGFELTVGRELGEGRKVKWGLEGGFGYAYVDAGWSGTASASVLSLDAFPLGGITPPTAPYAGPQTAGPGSPLLGTTPLTVPVDVAADLDAAIYGFRLGPYLEFQLAKCCSFTVGGGFSMAIVDSEFSFRESTAAPFGGLAQSGHDNKTDAVFGGYVSGQFNLRLGKGWKAFSGIQFHALTDFDQRVGDKVAKLSLGSAFAWTLGVQRHF